MDREHAFDVELFRTMAGLGLAGIPVPEEWGGTGLGYLDYVVFIEEVARECGSTAVVLSVHTGLGAMSLVQFGSQRLKEKYLRALATGEIIGAYALTEADAGSDAGALRCRAERSGDEFILNGSKTFITNGGIATTYNIFAKTDPSQPPGKGITCFVVEKGSPGFEIGKPMRWVVHLAGVEIGVHRIDGEIPPPRVVRQALAKGDVVRAVRSAVGIGLPAEGGVLHADGSIVQLYRTHLRRFRDHADAVLGHRKQNLLRGQAGANVDIRRRQAQ